jgi:hypothetical protein
MHRLFLILLSLPPMLATGAAGACTMVAAPHPPTPAEEQAAARLVVDRAAAIIDGQVIRPYVPGGTPALVRVHRVFRGPQRTDYAVGVLTSCDIPLMRPGERARMILSGGPDIWFIHMSTLSESAVDNLLGSDRRRDWPYVQETNAAP